LKDTFLEETFEANFSEQNQSGFRYEYCVFRNCDFSKTNFSEAIFESCEFIGCNFSNVQVSRATFQEVQFVDCKILGVRFDHANSIGLSFEFTNSALDFSSFYKLDLRNTLFKKSTFLETDFTESILTNSVFDSCDLKQIVFENTTLEKVNFLTSFNIKIDIENNILRGASFSLSETPGLLDSFGIKIQA